MLFCLTDRTPLLEELPTRNRSTTCVLQQCVLFVTPLGHGILDITLLYHVQFSEEMHTYVHRFSSEHGTLLLQEANTRRCTSPTVAEY